MTYSSLLEAYGWERFAEDVQAAGGASMIVADLPADERPELRRVQLVAPTSTDERIALAGAQPTAGSTSSPSRGRPACAARSPSALPASSSVHAGSSTSRSMPASASRRRSRRARQPSSRTASSSARGRLQVAEEGPDALREYVASLRAALDAAPVAI